MNYTWLCQYRICDLHEVVSEVEERTFIFARREDMIFAPPLFGVDMVSMRPRRRCREQVGERGWLVRYSWIFSRLFLEKLRADIRAVARRAFINAGAARSLARPISIASIGISRVDFHSSTLFPSFSLPMQVLSRSSITPRACKWQLHRVHTAAFSRLSINHLSSIARTTCSEH